MHLINHPSGIASHKLGLTRLPHQQIYLTVITTQINRAIWIYIISIRADKFHIDMKFIKKYLH